MVTIGIKEKSSNNLLHIFKARTLRSHPDYSDSNLYIHYSVEEGKYPEAYNWDGTQVVYDENYTPPQNPVAVQAYDAVVGAIEFGASLIRDFGAENVAMGITQLGKTADVLSVMEDRIEIDPVNKPNVKVSVMGTISSGSLYEAINAIDHHIAKADAGDYNHLAPFITGTRLTDFKNKILSHLGMI